MSIVEIINESNEVTRLEFWNDGLIKIKKAPEYSIMYSLKLQEYQKIYKDMSIRKLMKLTMNYVRNYK